MVHWPFLALSTNKISDEGIANLLKVIDGRPSKLAEPHSGSSLEGGQERPPQNLIGGYDSNRGRRNFSSKGYSRTLVVNEESVLFTIQSKFLSVFFFIAFFSSSISFRMLFKRSLLSSSDGFAFPNPFLLLLFSSSSFLLVSRLPSYCSCDLIS